MTRKDRRLEFKDSAGIEKLNGVFLFPDLEYTYFLKNLPRGLLATTSIADRYQWVLVGKNSKVQWTHRFVALDL